MSITITDRINAGKVVALLPDGAGFNATGAPLEQVGEKVLTGWGCTDDQLQAAVTSAAAVYVDVAANVAAVTATATAALGKNASFLALPTPNTPLNAAAQAALVAQVVALTRQVDALIRLALNDFDTSADS